MIETPTNTKPLWLQGDVLERLADIPDDCVQCVVTSPPYWGLRKYIEDDSPEKEFEIGLEPTLQEWLDKLVKVFREVRRVLRPDGVMWLNCGDAYCHDRFTNKMDGTYDGTDGLYTRKYNYMDGCSSNGPKRSGGDLKVKDCLMMDYRLALALQEPVEQHLIKDRAYRMWLAGVIDTDGCIGVRKQRASGDKTGKWNHTYIPYLTVSMSDTAVIEQCIRVTGYGKINLKQRADTTDNRGIKSRFDYFTWRLDGDKAVRILRDIWPYLLIKQRQAVCICTLDDSNKSSRVGRYAGKVPKDVMEKRDWLYQAVKKLNQREPVDIPSWVKEPKPNVEPGWWVRSKIVWAKPNPMPESCRDRPTSSYEMIFLLTKSARYFYDADAIREESQDFGSTSKYGEYGNTCNYKSIGHDKVKPQIHHEYRCAPGGRNSRNVWTIPTHPNPLAHFATFPPELVRRCIAAGTSEKGCCKKCGKPWIRVTDVTQEYQGRNITTRGDSKREPDKRLDQPEYKSTKHVKTLGWRPGCSCGGPLPWRRHWDCDQNEETRSYGNWFVDMRYLDISKWPETVPCTVLDCFAGIGTTLAVAARMGRASIGIELNPQYIADGLPDVEAAFKGITRREVEAGQEVMFE